MFYANIDLSEVASLYANEVDQTYSSEFAAELRAICSHLGLSDEEKLIIVDQENDEIAFVELGKHFNIMDDSGEFLTEDEEQLASSGWERIPDIPDSSAINYTKDGVVYSFAGDALEWFPSAIILAASKLKQ